MNNLTLGSRLSIKSFGLCANAFRLTYHSLDPAALRVFCFRPAFKLRMFPA